MILDLPKLAKTLEDAVRSFSDVAVVGISGGIDSAVVASVATAALGAKNVFVVSMPFDDSDRKTFNSRSAELAAALGAQHLVVEIGTATNALLRSFGKEYPAKSGQNSELHPLTRGNTRARMRMATLYALASELGYRFHEAHYSPGTGAPEQASPLGHRVRVLGTGNASEDLIGYDTKGGDALADLFIIGDLFKSEVYQLGQHYNVPQSILAAVPSAGLYPDQTDHAELGYSYDELEPALRALHKIIARGTQDKDVNPGLPEFVDVRADTAQFVVARFIANAHKHRAPAIVQVRASGLVS